MELKSTEHVVLLRKWLPSYLTSLCELGSSSHEDVVFIIVDCLQMVAGVGVGYHGSGSHGYMVGCVMV